MVRQALRQNPRRSQVSVGKSIPAPIGGWDAQNPLAAMPIQNAPWGPYFGMCKDKFGVQWMVSLPTPA